MEVKKLVCDVCGGQIEMQSGGKGVCTSCGTPYSAEIIKDKIQEIRGTVKVDGPVETVKGDAEKERLIKTAQECFRKGAVDEADKMFRKISKDYPNEWRAWMGIVYCESLSLSDIEIRQRYITPSGIGTYQKKENPEYFLNDEYKKALLFAPEDERLKINKYREDFCKALKQRIKKIQIQDNMKKLKEDINLKKSKIQEQEKDVEKNTKKYENEMTRRIIGGILIAIAIVICISTYETSFWGVVIGIAIGAVGACIWNWTGRGDRFKQSLSSSSEYLEKLKSEVDSAEKELAELKIELNKLN